MAAQSTVLVRFTTKLPPELRVADTEVAVPASLKRYGLSQIINHMLALEPPRPFDFVVDGELLRRSLEQHLLQHSISLESVVEVEYVTAVVAPEPQHAMPQDDWVTAVAGAASGLLLLSGGADGVARVWTGGGHCLHEFAAHKLGLNALAAVPSGVGGGSKGSSSSSKGSSERCLLLSAGKDHALRLWQVCATGQQQQQQQQQDASGAASAQCLVQYSGHKEAVQAVAASPSGTLCCSGGWDGQLLVWQTGAAVAEEAAAAAARGAAADTDSKAAGAAKHKRRRGASAAAAASHDAAGAPAAAPLQLQPASALLGHMHCVAGVAWPSAGVLYSGGWDHSVRRFDVESGRNTVTHNGSKAVYAVAAAADAAAAGGAGSADVVAFAGGDRVLRFWDSRSGAGEALAITAHSAHDGWVSALAWRPGSAYQLASGGCDGVVKLWDVRSGVPLASLQHHQQGEARAYGGAAAKVLAVSWAGHSTLLSGGSDCAMRVYAA